MSKTSQTGCESSANDGDAVECPRCGADAVQRVHEYDIPGFERSYSWVACDTCRKRMLEEEECSRAIYAEAWMKTVKSESGINGLLAGRSFDGYKASSEGQKRALAAAKIFAASDGPLWLAFCGTTGAGKSHLAAAIANQVIESGSRSVCYAKLVGMMQRFRSTFHSDSQETEERVARYYRRVNLLILDEFGTRGKLTEWEQATLDDILDYRWEQRSRTIIVSNMTAKEMIKAAGERVASRFADLGALVNFTWEDYRKRGGRT